jgi:predicted alpha/beta-hydrolase family hydrolase
LERRKAALGMTGTDYVLANSGVNRTPATTRADHLDDIELPMLFLQGTRDGLKPYSAPVSWDRSIQAFS